MSVLDAYQGIVRKHRNKIVEQFLFNVCPVLNVVSTESGFHALHTKHRLLTEFVSQGVLNGVFVIELVEQLHPVNELLRNVTPEKVTTEESQLTVIRGYPSLSRSHSERPGNQINGVLGDDLQVAVPTTQFGDVSNARRGILQNILLRRAAHALWDDGVLIDARDRCTPVPNPILRHGSVRVLRSAGTNQTGSGDPLIQFRICPF